MLSTPFSAAGRYVLAVLVALVLLIATAGGARAQSSRHVTGTVIDTEPRAVRVLVDAQHAESVSDPVRVLIPRWNGTNDAGAPVPVRNLRAVQLSARVRLDVDSVGQNVGPQPAERWRVETGVQAFWIRDGVTIGGGGALATYAAAGHELAGGAAWSWDESTGTPILADVVHVGACREQAAPWLGAGDVLLELDLRPVVQARGFPGHWREWSTVRVTVLDVEARYVLDAPAVPGRYRIEASPWVDHGILELGDVAALLDLPGASDPSAVLATWIEYAHEETPWVGIENLAAFSATCGGGASGGVRVLRGSEGLTWSNAACNVGSFAPVSAYDGSTDWQGVSGREVWGAASWTGVHRSAYFWGDSWAGDAQVRAVATHGVIEPESLTPGAAFAWDGAWRFSGRVRLVRAVRL